MNTVLQVDKDLTVYAVHELKEQLLSALGQSGTLTLDLSGVGEVDGAGVQLMLSLALESRQRDIGLYMKAPPKVLQEAFELVNICDEFRCAPEEEVAA